MAFINQVFAKDENLLKVGKSYDPTVRSLTSVSGSQIQFTPQVNDSAIDDYVGKVASFNNGQVKTISAKVVDATAPTGYSNTVFDVEPSNVQIPNTTSFVIDTASLYIDDASRIHFGKSTPGIMMAGGETGIDLNFGRIRNGALPTHAHDLVTKQYVDSQKMGVWNQLFTFDGDDVTSIFTIYEPISIHNALISVGGVIQNPYEAYNIEQYDGFTRIVFSEPPPFETQIAVRASTATNVTMSPAIEEIFVSTNNQDTFPLENEVLDKYGLVVSVDGVVQSTLNYDILTTPVVVTTQDGKDYYKGNEYKILKFAEGLDVGAIVRVLNLRGKNFHSHVGTYIMLNNNTLVPNTTFIMNGIYDYDTIENSGNTVNVTHDMIANRGGLHLYANTTVSDLYINLPEMGGEYSPDQHLEVKVVKGMHTANVYINADNNNFMNYEGQADGHLGGGVVYSKEDGQPSVIHLEYESYYKTWYIKYGMGLWYVNANTVNYPNVSPY